MKVCPLCQTSFEDELRWCLRDGTALVQQKQAPQWLIDAEGDWSDPDATPLRPADASLLEAVREADGFDAHRQQTAEVLLEFRDIDNRTDRHSPTKEVTQKDSGPPPSLLDSDQPPQGVVVGGELFIEDPGDPLVDAPQDTDQLEIYGDVDLIRKARRKGFWLMVVLPVCVAGLAIILFYNHFFVSSESSATQEQPNASAAGDPAASAVSERLALPEGAVGHAQTKEDDEETIEAEDRPVKAQRRTDAPIVDQMPRDRRIRKHRSRRPSSVAPAGSAKHPVNERKSVKKRAIELSPTQPRNESPPRTDPAAENPSTKQYRKERTIDPFAE